jgi:hypothetical protein
MHNAIGGFMDDTCYFIIPPYASVFQDRFGILQERGRVLIKISNSSFRADRVFSQLCKLSNTNCLEIFKC